MIHKGIGSKKVTVLRSTYIVFTNETEGRVVWESGNFQNQHGHSKYQHRSHGVRHESGVIPELSINTSPFLFHVTKLELFVVSRPERHVWSEKQSDTSQHT